MSHGPPGVPGVPVQRLRRTARGVRRRLLARRRLIAALLAAVGVTASLRVLAPPPEAGTEVVVAARALSAGSMLTEADLSRTQVEAEHAPARAVTEPVGRVLAGPLDAGEVVSETRLVGPALGDLTPGRVPVPVRLPDAEMAALLRVGDRVDLLAADPAAGSGAGATLVAAGVDVLAVPVSGGERVGRRRRCDRTPGPGGGAQRGRDRRRGGLAGLRGRVRDFRVDGVLTLAAVSPSPLVPVTPDPVNPRTPPAARKEHPMSGFKNFVLRGSLVDLAVAVIIATAFGAVVTTFTSWLTGLLPDSTSAYFSNEPDSFGAFLNATVSFVLLAAIVYFFVVTPYTRAREKYFPSPPPGTPEEIELLRQIRDSLAGAGPTTPTAGTQV